MIDHFDYQYANEHDVKGIAKVVHQYDIPFLYNGAYTVGVMPVDGKEIGADFVVGSGHKSMASPAPLGVLATTDEWAPKIFRTTQMVGDVTRRKFGIKEVEMLDCTLMGSTLLRNDKNIISSISVTDIVFDDYLGKWNYRAIPK